MRYGRGLSPAMMKYRYHELPSAVEDTALLRRTVRLEHAAIAPEAGEAFAAWLGHVQAGRIAVR